MNFFVVLYRNWSKWLHKFFFLNHYHIALYRGLWNELAGFKILDKILICSLQHSNLNPFNLTARDNPTASGLADWQFHVLASIVRDCNESSSLVWWRWWDVSEHLVGAAREALEISVLELGVGRVDLYSGEFDSGNMLARVGADRGCGVREAIILSTIKDREEGNGREGGPKRCH